MIYNMIDYWIGDLENVASNKLRIENQPWFTFKVFCIPRMAAKVWHFYRITFNLSSPLYIEQT